jgi:DNA-directed RNA polymerase III subunit RPC6
MLDIIPDNYINTSTSKSNNNNNNNNNNNSNSNSVDPQLDLEVERKLLSYRSSHAEGVSESEFRLSLSHIAPLHIANTINRLLKENRLFLFENANKETIFKALTLEEGKSFKGLTQADMLIYHLIAREQSQGLWIKNIRQRSNLPVQQVPKILKKLEEKKLIKAEQSIEGKNKKVYMLYDLEPAKEIKGGAWYTTNSHAN